MAEPVIFNVQMINFQARLQFVDPELVHLTVLRLRCSNMVLRINTSEQSVIGSRPDRLLWGKS
jgi:hypothetical protein